MRTIFLSAMLVIACSIPSSPAFATEPQNDIPVIEGLDGLFKFLDDMASEEVPPQIEHRIDNVSQVDELALDDYTPEQLKNVLTLVVEVTANSRDPEVQSARRVLNALQGALLTGHTQELLNTVRPFTLKELERLNKKAPKPQKDVTSAGT